MFSQLEVLPPKRSLFALAIVGLLTFAPGPLEAVTAPEGFVVENAFPGAVLDGPVQILFLQDGRKLVAEQNGLIWTFLPDGTQLPTPFLDLEAKVLGNSGRGLLGVALDPDFDVEPWIYVTYTADPDSDLVDNEIDTWSRIERYQVDAGNPDVADLSTRQILLGGSWSTGIPVLDTYHVVGMMRFAADGTLLVASGDGAHFDQMDPGGLDASGFGPGRADPAEDIGAFRAQTLASLCGKILRLDPDTGWGVPSNPYFDGDPASNRSRVWLYGVRNGFRFTIRPGTGSNDPADADVGVLYIGDVGWNTYEELNIVDAGGLNLGWPCEEGPLPQPQYQAAPQPSGTGCPDYGSFNNPLTPTGPVLWWHHNDAGSSNPPIARGSSVTGGVFVTGSNYPAPFEGSYLVADFPKSWMYAVQVDASNNVVGVTDFLFSADGPTDMAVDPFSGDVYYAAYREDEVRRIRYVGTPPPVTTLLMSARADSADGSAPHPVGSAVSPWVDLRGSHDLTLAGISGTAGSGWAGSGLPGNPHRLELDGVDDRVILPGGSVPELVSPAAATLSLWFKTGDDIFTTQYLAQWLQSYSAAADGMGLAVEGGQLRIFLDPWTDVFPVAANTWYHVVAVKEPTEARVYVNGVLQLLQNGSPGLGSQVSELVLGASTFRGPGTYGEFLQGCLGAVRLWDGVLGAAEVSAEYDADKDLYAAVPPQPSGLLVHVRADSANGIGPYPSPGTGSPWRDVVAGYAFDLDNFGGTSSSGWLGDGTPENPYRLRFDGINDHAILAGASVPGLLAPSAATVSLWVRTGSDVSNLQFVYEWIETFSGSYPGMTLAVQSGQLRIFLGGWSDVAPLAPETWYHVAVTQEVGDTRVYLNGTENFATSSSNLGAQLAPFVLGGSSFATSATAGTDKRAPGSPLYHFGGDLAQVRVYDIALPAGDVVEQYEAERALYFPPPPPNEVTWAASATTVPAFDQCVTLAAVLDQRLPEASMAASVTFSVSDELALCLTEGSSIFQGPWLAGYSNQFFSVRRVGPYSWTVDQALLGSPCGVALGDTLFTVELRGLEQGTVASVTLDSVNVRSCDGLIVPTVMGESVDITVENSGATSALPTPGTTRLHRPAPNPFNPRTEIRFDLGQEAPVRLAVYSVAGRLIRRLVDARLPAGGHSIAWDGRRGDGRRAPSGVYLVRLEALGQRLATRLVLVE